MAQGVKSSASNSNDLTLTPEMKEGVNLLYKLSHDLYAFTVTHMYPPYHTYKLKSKLRHRRKIKINKNRNKIKTNN